MLKQILFVLFLIFITVTSHDLNICDKNNKCVEKEKCNYHDDSSYRVCGYKNGKTQVCCSEIGSVTVQKCREFTQVAHGLDIVEFSYYKPRHYHYPFLVALGYGLESDIKWKCSGGLIGPKFVLTTAHCVNLPNYGRVKYARMGTEDFHSKFDVEFRNKISNESRQDFYIKRSMIHPDFNAVSRQNDIAILKLSQKVKYTSYTQMACLNVKNKWLSLTTIGWGRDMKNELKLFRYYHNLVPDNECVNYYKKLERSITTNSQICLKDYEEYNDQFCVKPYENFCQKYSGSLVIGYDVNLRMYLISGIASFGDDCYYNSTMPGIYTRVSYYIDWIEKNVWK